MRIERLRVEQFRNLVPQMLELHPQTTVFVGDNGQGKTNLLEAVYLLAALRSFRTARLAECITFGDERARVRGHVLRRTRACDVEVSLSGAGRRVEVDGKALRSPREYRGDLCAIVFVPEDLTLARGSPDGRRRFLDRAVFVTAPAHLADLLDYDRALKSRNVLLRDGAPRGAELDAHTVVLARLGAAILWRRREWARSIEQPLREILSRVGATTRRAGLAYEARGVELAGAAEREAIEARLLEAYERTRAHDLARGHTSVGPHADDVTLTLDDHLLRIAGSQGQQRAFILALKLAEVANAEKFLGEPPVLLLDDVGSELDETRRAALFSHLAALERGEGAAAMPAQILVTTTALELLPHSHERRVFRVERGAATPLP
jgi:DNA replication and repair protein RecF